MTDLIPSDLSGRYRLLNARVPLVLLADGLPDGASLDRDGAACVDILVDRGRIETVTALGGAGSAEGVDLAGRHVWPHLVDVHAHLDKAHIVDRAPNPTGDFAGARDATTADRTAHWRRDDLLRRMAFGLGCAAAHGVGAIRTHLDSHEGQAEESWAAFATMRDRWSETVTLQAVALAPVDIYRSAYGRTLADLVALNGGILGGVTRASGGMHGGDLADLDVLLDQLFTLARERDLDIDLHVDEAPVAAALPRVARAAIRHGYEGRVTCGHCCSLALLPPADLDAIIALLSGAGVSIVTLPTVNMYLQDREPGRTPRWRGVTPVKELRDAGVRVAAAGDNCRDPFFAYGDHDMLDTFRQSVRILHLDHPVAAAPALVGPVPAAIMRLDGHGTIGRASPADLMVLEAWSMDQVIARPQSDRTLIKRGRRTIAPLPSYAAL